MVQGVGVLLVDFRLMDFYRSRYRVWALQGAVRVPAQSPRQRTGLAEQIRLLTYGARIENARAQYEPSSTAPASAAGSLQHRSPQRAPTSQW